MVLTGMFSHQYVYISRRSRYSSWIWCEWQRLRTSESLQHNITYMTSRFLLSVRNSDTLFLFSFLCCLFLSAGRLKTSNQGLMTREVRGRYAVVLHAASVDAPWLDSCRQCCRHVTNCFDLVEKEIPMMPMVTLEADRSSACSHFHVVAMAGLTCKQLKDAGWHEHSLELPDPELSVTVKNCFVDSFLRTQLWWFLWWATEHAIDAVCLLRVAR